MRFQGDQIARHSLRCGRDWPLDQGRGGDDEPLVAGPECDESCDEAGDDDAGASATGRPVVVHGGRGSAVSGGQDVGSALFGVDGHDGVKNVGARLDEGVSAKFRDGCRRRRLEMQAKAVGAVSRSGPRGLAVEAAMLELPSWELEMASQRRTWNNEQSNRLW